MKSTSTALRRHASSLYAESADPSLAFPSLDDNVRADVTIIGGGYTGLAAALHLAEAGVDVAVIEAERVGWGASGRNGGQLHSGQRRDQDWLEAKLGRDDAHALWSLAEEAKALVKDLIARHGIDCDWRPGLIETVHKRRLVASEIAYVEKLRRDYGYEPVEWLDRGSLAAAIGTDVYFGGRRDMGAGHLDPLKLARGLARAAAGAGARIFEATKAVQVSGTAATGFTVEVAAPSPPDQVRGSPRERALPHTQFRSIGVGRSKAADIGNSRYRAGGGSDSSGTRSVVVKADIVILAGNGYLDGIDAYTEARVMPIDNYILATAPIGAGRPGGLIRGGEAVSDTRFVVYYFRPSPDGRLIFGGGETYSRRPPAALAEFVTRHLLRIYPQLKGTRVDYAWGGTLAITMKRLPFIRRLRPGVYVAAGYSGQGVALAPFAGKVLADAIRGDTARLDRFAALPVPPFPGGKLLRYPALVAGMSWYALRDRL